MSPRQPAVELGPRANRTIARILEATREVFLTSGYAGTTIDEVATAAGISRASFYTYFPSKREVLLALGAQSASDAIAVVGTLAALPPSLDSMTTWVGQYFAFLDNHGAFAFAWTQAAQHDEEIRIAGMKTHLVACRKMGEAMAQFGGSPVSDPTTVGLTSFGMLERAWDYCRLYGDELNRERVGAEIAAVLWASVAPSQR